MIERVSICRIAVEGIVGSGTSAFLWEVERYGSAEVIWDNERSLLDGDFGFEEYFGLLAQKYTQWKYGSPSMTFYDKSVLSVLSYAQWDFRTRQNLSKLSYDMLKKDTKSLIDDCPLPNLILYFECAPNRSPLPRSHYISLDEIYETWLSVMESKGVHVMRVQPIQAFGLDQEFWAQKLIEQIQIFTRATYQ